MAKSQPKLRIAVAPSKQEAPIPLRHWHASPHPAPDGTAAIAIEKLKSRFLARMQTPEIASLLAAATKRRFLANSVIVNQGDAAEHMFLVAEGRVRHFFLTEQGRKVLLLWLAPGDVFGGMALLPTASAYLLSTETVEDSLVFVWRRDVIRNLVARYPKLQENALTIASDYLTWYIATHSALISSNARERLANVLISLAQGNGDRVPGGIRLHITNEQLANTANVTPFTASRLLSEWQRNGAVAKNRGSVVLRAAERLFEHHA